MRGSITVFLSMIMVVILSAVTTSVESARLACTRLFLKQAGGYSIKSVFADYYVPLFKDYGLMFLDVTYGGDENLVTEKFEEYLSYNMNPNKGRLEKRSFFYAAEALDIELKDIIYAVEGDGRIVKRQIYEYMKYKLPADFAESFLSQYDYYFHAEELQKFFDQIEKVQDELEDIDGVVLEINNLADTVKEYQAGISELIGRIESKKGLDKKELEKLSKLLEDEKIGLSDTVASIEEVIDEYDSLTEEVRGYLVELGDDWLSDMEVPGFIKDIIMDEIEALLQYSGGEGDAYGIDASKPYIDELRAILEEESGEGLSKLLNIDIPVNSGGEDTGDFSDIDWEGLMAELRDRGIYSLICPGYSDISDKSIKTFYNRNYAEREGGLIDIPEKSVIEAVAENICMAEYSVMFFADFCNSMEDRPAECETEYIIGGSLNEKDNINTVINRLIGIREVLNLLYLMCDSEKKSDAHTLALSMAGAGGTAAVKLTQYLIMAVWALGEAVIDTRVLMSGGSVPFMKEASDWRLDLYEITDIFEIINKTDYSGNSVSGACEYSDYLKLILFIYGDNKQAFRIMDLVEEDIQNKYYSEFYFNNCAYYAEVKADYKSEPLFGGMEFLLPKTSMLYKYSY